MMEKVRWGSFFTKKEIEAIWSEAINNQNEISSKEIFRK